MYRFCIRSYTFLRNCRKFQLSAEAKLPAAPQDINKPGLEYSLAVGGPGPDVGIHSYIFRQNCHQSSLCGGAEMKNKERPAIPDNGFHYVPSRSGPRSFTFRNSKSFLVLGWSCQSEFRVRCAPLRSFTFLDNPPYLGNVQIQIPYVPLRSCTTLR